MKVLKYARGLIVLGVLMIGVAVAPASWTARAGLDFWNVPRLKAEIAANEQFARVMDAESEVLTHRIQTKDQLVKELIAGRASLAAVSEQFRTLNGDDPEVVTLLKKHYRLEDERAVAARNVIDFADTYLDSDENAAKKPLVMKRLDEEFECMFPTFEIVRY